MLDLTATREDQNIHGETKRVTRPEVGAQVLQNFAGGCGVAIAIAAIQAMAGVSAVVYWQWPVYIGAFAFGASMAVRSQIDEVKGWHNMRAIIKQSRAEVEASKEKHREEMALLCIGIKRLEQKCSLEQIARAEAEADSNVLRARLNDAELEAAIAYREKRRAESGPRTILREDWSTPTVQRNTRTLVDFWTTKRLVEGQLVYVYPSRDAIMGAKLMTKNEWESAMLDLRASGCVGKAIPKEPPPAAELFAKLAIYWANPRPSRPDGWTGLEVADDDGRTGSGEGE